ncbi:anti-sigma factor family protein [Actinokineospora bangkokensis]|uniref:Uncharacterized protein n=1 Tax=Actinokineospora bangkokensis TaxID=1193682 RepID=A0A1Q9LGA8_9PSEU|nr:hypothetical protein [Actinokineospora bangkokensis]OLR91050.1 hypothetical protein BJP25_31415 [Actinokineospora bangkokensis]
MTDEVRGGASPSGPPWSVDLLADLHAGVLEPRQAQRLWAQVNGDPAARAVLDALESVRTGLGELGAAPVPPMPSRFASELDAALEAEAARHFGGGVAAPPRPPGVAPVVDIAAARRKRGRLTAWAGGLVAVAAAAVAIGFAVVPTTTPGVPSAQMSDGGKPRVQASSGDLSAAIGQVNGARDYGDLGDEAGLQRCLSQVGVDAKAPVLGVRPITLDGTPGTMVMLLPGSGQLGKFRVLVLQSGCQKIFDNVIG